MADLRRRDAALIFTSVYVANDAALATLAREIPGIVVLSDELAGMIITAVVVLSSSASWRSQDKDFAPWSSSLAAWLP